MQSERSHGIQSWLGLVLAVTLSWTASGSAQTALRLASLTVPDGNLPNSCRLRPRPDVPPTTSSGQDDTVTVVATREPSYRFPSNPWLGRDPRLLIDLRRGMDGSPRLPDGPPLSPAEVSALEARWIADVVEGYRAVYVSAEGTLVRVSAIRFDDASLAATGELAHGMQTSQDPSERLVVGGAVIVVRADSKAECFDAVVAYIRALE